MSSPTAPPDDERQEELATIASIFPDEFAIFAPSSAVISLPVSPLEPLAVSFPSEPRALLRHLPPLLLKFVLPELYPAEAPPHIELSTTPPWLPQDTRDALKTECLKLWEDYGRGQVMFAIIDHAQQCAERGFGFNGELMLEDSMRDELLAFDLETRKSVFNQGTYNCGICLEPKKGAICHAIRSCGHIFCRPCLVNYFTSLITDGEVGSVRCSDAECVRKATRPQSAAQPENTDGDRNVGLPPLPPTLPPEELTEIGVPADLVTRYFVMKKKKALDRDPKTIFCPRQWCQSASRSSVQMVEDSMSAAGSGYWLPDLGSEPLPVPHTEDVEKEPENSRREPEKLQLCSVCAFAFCRKCEASWHGDFQICKPKDGSLSEEELANEKYLKENTTPCPTCTTPVIKSQGCNHMICTCSTHFCFLCSSYLPPDEPYAHFNTRGTSCYMQLWHGEHGDQEPVGDAPLAGGAPREQVPVMPPAEAAQVLAEENAAPLAEELDLIELQRAFIIEFDDGSDTEPENEIAFEDVPDEPLPPAPGRARGRGRGRGGGEERGRGRGRGGELRGVRGERVRDARPGWIHRRERLVQE